MKTKIISIVVMLMMAVNAMAQDYLTVFFKDGKTESFYMRAVNKFYTSKYDSLGVFHDDFQTQVIETTKNTFSYALSEIDSVSFTKFNEEEVKKNFISAISASSEVFSKCDSIDDLAKYIDELRQNEGIESVSYDDNCLYVDVKDWQTIVFFFDVPHEEDTQSLTTTIRRGKSLVQQYGSPYTNFSAIEALALSPIGTRGGDWEKYFVPLQNELNDCGISVFPTTSPSITNGFYTDEIFKHDIVFYQSHGGYDKDKGIHYLQTADEYGVTKRDYNPTDEEWNQMFDWLRSLTEKTIQKDEITVGSYNDFRPSQGGRVWVWGAWITEKYIENSPNRFEEPAIVFVSACLSLAGDGRDFSSVFLKKGALAYFGSENTQSSGVIVTKHFIEDLLNGMSMEGARSSMDLFYSEDVASSFFDYFSAGYKVKYQAPSESKKKFHLFNVYTRNVDSNKAQQEYSENGKVTVSGVTTLLDKDKPKVEFGFKYGTDKNNLSKTKKGKYDSSITDELGNFCFTVDLEMSNNQNLYYQAYTYDGYCYNLGEPKQITIKNNESYAVYNAGTLTFYHDQLKNSRDGSVYGLNTEWNYPSWYSSHDEINKVVFDKSFANARPTSTFFWFHEMKNLASIEGIQYLNTSEVTNMYGMFYDCKSLTSLNVSSFNTKNVTNMYEMFYDCESLTSLDVSNFNTANVTDMSWMFYDCESLTSLDVSNFNTKNVRYMAGMFMFCGNLTSLNVSNFNTEKVTDMCDMFSFCEKLTSLDVSNFNTEKVTDMCDMFYDCESLTSLDVSNFDTRNVTDMRYMFCNCWNLNTLDVSNFIMAVCEHSECMFLCCYGLNSLAVSSTMENLDESACEYVGDYEPCSIIAPEGFNFKVDTSGDSFTWKSGKFKIDN